MKHLFLTLAILGLATTAVAGENIVKAQVPFDFTAGKTVLPAGTYMLERGGPQGMITLKDAAGRCKALLPVNGRIAAKVPVQTFLVFNRYGDRYFLSEAWAEGHRAGVVFHKLRLERELVAAGQAAGPVFVAAAR